MIDGLKIQFTTLELQDHLAQAAFWWDLQADRVLRAMESRGGEATEAQLGFAKERIRVSRRQACKLRKVLRQLPIGEIFSFEVRDMRVEEIGWPQDPGLTDAELEAAIFQDPRPTSPFLEMLRAAGANAREPEE